MNRINQKYNFAIYFILFLSQCNLIQFISTHNEKKKHICGQACRHHRFEVFTKHFVKTCLNHKDDPWSDKWYAIIDTDSAD